MRTNVTQTRSCTLLVLVFALIAASSWGAGVGKLRHYFPSESSASEAIQLARAAEDLSLPTDTLLEDNLDIRLLRLQAAETFWMERTRLELEGKIAVDDNAHTLVPQRKHGVKVSIRSIFIRRLGTPDFQDHEQRTLEAIAADLAAGIEFSAVARRWSDARSRRIGGAANNLWLDSLGPTTRNALLKLEPGEISPPITTDAGTTILLLESKETIYPLGDDERAALAREQAHMRAVIEARQQAVELAKSQITTVHVPKNEDDLANETAPWIEFATLQPIEVGLPLRMALRVGSWDPSEPKLDAWELESTFLQDALILGAVAEAEGILATPEGQAILEEGELLRRWETRKRQFVHQWEATDPQIEEWLVENKDQFPAFPRFSGSYFSIPRPDPERAHEMLRELDSKVQELRARVAPTELLLQLAEIYPEGKIVPFEDVDTIGALRDGPASRLEPGETGWPFETDSEVIIVHISERKPPAIAQDELKKWARWQMRQDAFEELKKRLLEHQPVHE